MTWTPTPIPPTAATAPLAARPPQGTPDARNVRDGIEARLLTAVASAPSLAGAAAATWTALRAFPRRDRSRKENPLTATAG